MERNPPFLVNIPQLFFGVDGYRFKLGAQVFEAVEDPNDGYRSYLGSIEVRDEEPGIFFSRPLDTARAVAVEEVSDGDGWRRAFRGWALTSCIDGHRWLLVGTYNADDYYPTFCFEYTPRRP
jgi:hypothetical protein